LTEIRTYASPTRVGRKKQFEERITLPLSADMLARIDAVLADDEPRLDMIREAIEREIKRRARQSKED
jgi:metal-responsive CopG/Arc/MetJ family transcriptional regulator